jgi:hypothetical protein
MKRDGPQPDVYSYNAFMLACSNAGQIDTAIHQVLIETCEIST